MSGTIFFFCSTTAIPALSVVLKISAWPTAPKRGRRGCKNKKKMTGLWRNSGQRRWTWPSLSRQVLHLWTVGLRRRAWGYSKPQVGRLSVQGNLTQKEIPTQRRVLKDGKSGATDKDQESLNYGDCLYRETSRTRIPRISRKPKNSRKFRRLGNRWKILPYHYMYHQTVCLPWARSSRSFDLLLVEVRQMTLMTSMWTQLFGVSFWLLLFKLQFIVGKIFRKICDIPRINPWSLWDNYFKRLTSWSRIPAEITGLSTIDWKQPMWKETTLL